MSRITLLSDLVPSQRNAAIHVKIITKWSTPVIGSLSPKVGLLLGDEKGFKIEATCDHPLDLSNGFSVEVGAWFEIYNFKVTPAFAKIKKASGLYHIKISESSMIYKIEPINDCSFLCLAKFDNVLGGFCHPKFCIDLCGALVGVGNIEPHDDQALAEIHGGPNKIQFTLINIGLKQLKCVAFGSQADQLYDFLISTRVNPLLCVLSLWRIEWGEGCFKFITNTEGSQMLFDPDLPEIQDFKLRIPQLA